MGTRSVVGSDRPLILIYELTLHRLVDNDDDDDDEDVNERKSTYTYRNDKVRRSQEIFI
jgi:hypothetical protein